MQTVWYALLGVFFAGYFVLGGYDYGVGVLLSGVRTPEERQAALNAIGPFFLGNEVWLVAAAGVLFGAFPVLEGELLAGLYPLVVTVLIGVVGVLATVQLRSRSRAPRARAGWDRLIVAASVIAAAGWGAVLGAWLQGTGSTVVTPFAAMVAALLAARAALARRGWGLAFAATGLCLALPMVLVLGATYPYALAPDLTVGQAAAAPATLSLLAWLALPLVPALVGFQLMCWWTFRSRVDREAPAFY